jgi:hypothetical protein
MDEFFTTFSLPDMMDMTPSFPLKSRAVGDLGINSMMAVAALVR